MSFKSIEEFKEKYYETGYVLLSENNHYAEAYRSNKEANFVDVVVYEKDSELITHSTFSGEELIVLANSLK